MKRRIHCYFGGDEGKIRQSNRAKRDLTSLRHYFKPRCISFPRAASLWSSGNIRSLVAGVSAAASMTLALPSATADTLIRGGLQQLRAKEYSRAILNLGMAFDRAPFDEAVRLGLSVAYQGRALAYYRTREYGAAVADLSQALKLSPRASAYYWRGAAHLEIGRFDEAITDFEGALRLDPNTKSALSKRAAAYLANGDLARALADYEQAMARSQAAPRKGEMAFILSDDRRIIRAEGSISSHTPVRFKQFLQRNRLLNPDGSMVELASPITVALNSTGGNLMGSLMFGATIRWLGLNTSVGHLIFGRSYCTSGCAYAFLGGVKRTINEYARIGIHQTSIERDDGRHATGSSVLPMYVDNMGADAQLVEAAEQVHFSSIKYLTTEEAWSWQVTTREVIKFKGHQLINAFHAEARRLEAELAKLALAIVDDAREHLQAGNVEEARKLLQPYADRRIVEAITALAESYDPERLAGWGVTGRFADRDKADELYAKAERVRSFPWLRPQF